MLLVDTACEEATYLANLCQKVYMIVRKPYFRASEIMQQRVFNNPKIEVLFEHNTLRLTGETKVEGADLIYKKGLPDEEQRHIAIDGFFLAIGHQPNTKLFADYLDLDAEGYIRVQGDSPCTNVPGVYAAGDKVTFTLDPTAGTVTAKKVDAGSSGEEQGGY